MTRHHFYLLQALRLDYLVQKVRPILTKLMSSGTGPQRGLFNVPVDPLKLGIPDYFKRVPHPMDLVSGRPQAAGVRLILVSVCFRVVKSVFGFACLECTIEEERGRQTDTGRLLCRFG